MGLGLFIAKTLLERSGAEISFANGTDPFLTRAEHPDRFGAIVEVRWPKSVIVAPETDALGPNRPLDG
jgi:two-component system sensor histidine kinase RegB